ncbi:hypothetical protein TWF696_001424 [Orbilia brochopaga]|uniref:F-box domain-containing protein n=1 Tax=Orbilia brochopaga TaxID=3140254 RepID=A0AAV9U9E3_9PEZI
MLRRAFRKFHISKVDVDDLHAPSSCTNPIERLREAQSMSTSTLTMRDAKDASTTFKASQHERDANSSCPFLNLPLDIIDLIIQHISFRDRITLSLTARGLRHLRRPTYGVDQPDTHTETPTNPEECARRISSRLLYRQPVICPESTIGPHNCPFCAHPLCLPTSCPSALILDSATGIFFSPSLYRTRTAKFKYAPSETEERKCKLTQGEYYSTIWCSHHRCPRDLLSLRRYQSVDTQLGAQRYLAEDADMNHWGLTRLYYPLSSTPRARWLVGHRVQHSLRFLAAECGLKPANRADRLPSPLRARLSNLRIPADVLHERRKDEATYLEPVYEKFWYTSYCLHCLLPLTGAQDYGGGTNGPSCRCNASPHTRFTGCRRCGIASVKITTIEVFDAIYKREGPGIWRSSHWLHLATECKVVETPQDPIPQRLRPTAGQAALDAALRIIRGVAVLPVANGRVGLQDLPLKLVLWIMTLHNRADETKLGHVYISMAAYLFVKAWYGDVAGMMVRGVLDRTDFAEKDERWPHARRRGGSEPIFILGS